MRVSRAVKNRKVVARDLEEAETLPRLRGSQVSLAGSSYGGSFRCSSNGGSAVTMAGGGEHGGNVGVEDCGALDVNIMDKEGSGNPEFDFENAVAACPEEDCSGGNRNPHKKVHVSGDNISLYVEFCSPKCEIMCKTADEVGYLQEAGDLENLEEIGTGGCEFAAGDVVWVKTKTKLWWPGKIRNRSEVSSHRVKVEPEGCLLVSYMANGHVSWYNPSQLKPFYENFVHMSRQDKSKTFVAAVEKAVEEFGFHFKLRLTSLASLQAQGQASSTGMKSNKASMIGAFDEVSATLLDSRDLISHLKNLAVAVSKPRVLEPAILRGYLSAFYCSPMSRLEVVASGLETDPSGKSNNLSRHKIEGDKGIQDISASKVVGEGPKRESKSRKRKEADDSVSRYGGDDKVEGFDGAITQGEGSGSGSSEKGTDLRPRKKSKYLSYPYINLEGKGLPVKVDDDVASFDPVVKLSSKFQQKWSKISAEELSTISSVELLLWLRIAASGCLHPCESENLERVEGFFYRFRSSSFHGDWCADDMFNNSTVAEKEKQSEGACEADEARKTEKSGRKNLESPVIVTMEACGEKENPGKSNLESPLIAMGEIGGKKEKPPEKILASPLTETQENGRNLEVRKPPHILLGAVNIGITDPLQIPAKESSGLLDLSAGGRSSVRSEFSGRIVLPVHVGFTEGNHARKKRKRMNKDVIEPGKAVETPGLVPDLNGTHTSANSLGNDPQGTNLVPAQIDLRKRKRKGRGTPIILTFSEDNSMPPKEVLEAEFSKFGFLQSVIAPSLGNPNVARVIFNKKSDANKAHRSLEKSNPFGGALVKFELQLSFPSKALENLTLRAASFTNGASINPLPKSLGPAARTVEASGPSLTRVLTAAPRLTPAPSLTPVLTPAPSLTPVLTPAPPLTSVFTPAPPLDRIKQNLEIMTSMLKESGDDLSPETRAKLELEIKGLLSKVSTRVCSPSS